MVSGISGQNNNWANVVVNTESEAAPAAVDAAGKSSAVDKDSFEVTAGAGSSAPSHAAMADSVPTGGFGGWVAENVFGYDVSILKEEKPSLPTSKGQMKSWASTLGLSYAQQKTAGKLYEAVSKQPGALDVICSFMQSPAFIEGGKDFQNSIMELAMRYPNAEVLSNVAKLPDVAWFKALAGADKQRACWLIANMSNNTLNGDTGDYNKYMYGGIDALLSGKVELSFNDSRTTADHPQGTNQVIVGRSLVKTGSSASQSEDFNMKLVTNSLAMQAFWAADIPYYVMTAMEGLAGNQEYQQMPAEVKKAFIKMIQNCGGKDEIMDIMNKAIATPAFKALDTAAQCCFLSQVGSKNSTETAGMVDVINSPWLAKMDGTSQALAINLCIGMNNINANGDLALLGAVKNGAEMIKAGDIKLQFSDKLEGQYEIKGNELTISSRVAADSAALGQLMGKICQDIEADRNRVQVPMASVADVTGSALYKALSSKEQNLVLKAAKGCKSAADFANLSVLLSAVDANKTIDKMSVFEVVSSAKDAEKGAVAGLMAKMVNAKSFNKLAPAAQKVLLAQCKNYPKESAVSCLTSLPYADWFTKMETPDMQRAAKTMAHCAVTGAEANFDQQKAIVTNSVNTLITGKVGLSFVDIQDEPGTLTGGYTYGDQCVYLNRKIVSANDNAFRKETCYDVVEVICHECNHEVNHDNNQADYKYYQAEYRAWYVGFVAANGRVPTQQECFDRSYSLFQLYGTINSALFSCGEESKKIIAFLSLIAGKELHGETVDEIRALLRTRVTNPRAEGQLPDPCFNPDMDN